MNNVSTKIYAANMEELKNESLYGAAYMKITNERRRKTDGFRLQKDRKLSVGAEILLMHGLEQMGININETAYKYGTNGKPYLAGRQDVYFNLSHSEDIVICAISSQEIGCDVEKISEINLGIARRFFSTEEYEIITAGKTEEEMRDIFFRLWTLKESFIKLTGRGLSLPMNSFCIHFDTDKISVKQKLDDRTYYFKEFNLQRDYKCSICGLDFGIGTNDKVKIEMLKLSDILNVGKCSE